MDIPPPGVETGQLAKIRGWKEKCMDRRYLARSENYRLSGQNFRYGLDMGSF
jgi:hypothetical protein